MLSSVQNTLVVIAIVATSMFCLKLLNRIWPASERREHNDLIGWQLSITGTTYAVILGFMLYTVWTDYGTADLNVDGEANSLVNVYRLAKGLPDPQRSQLQELTRAYADAILHLDWPQMAEGVIPEESSRLNTRMWRILMSVKAATPGESTAEDHALTELQSLTARRRMRLLQSTSQLPNVLWCVLILGAAITLLSACLFGSANGRVHLLQVTSFSLLLALVLVAVADIDRPFQGAVHVESDAFARAQQNMQQ